MQNTYKFKKGDRVQVFKFIAPANYSELRKSNLRPQEIFKQFTREITEEQGAIFKKRKRCFGAASGGNEYLVKYDNGSEEWHNERELELL